MWHSTFPSARARRWAATLIPPFILLLAACAGPDRVDTVQVGYRGTAMVQNYRHGEVHARFDTTHVPAPLPPAEPMPPGPLPWQNVQVLNDISVTEFLRTMSSFALWVGGDPANCQFCHVVEEPWSDTTRDGRPLYRKLVARRMIQMVRQINGQYAAHVGNTGVTCYTCHLGRALPSGLWYYANQNDYLRHYLDRDGARVVTQQVAPTAANRSSVKQAEWTYALMMSQSRSLGVNCTYCHNSRQFSSWQQAPPQRVKAYMGILMLRDVNTSYLAPLTNIVPATRLGAKGDAPKAQCVTCHNGIYKPLYGAQLTAAYPALWGRPEWNGQRFPAQMQVPAAAPAQ